MSCVSSVSKLAQPLHFFQSVLLLPSRYKTDPSVEQGWGVLIIVRNGMTLCFTRACNMHFDNSFVMDRSFWPGQNLHFMLFITNPNKYEYFHVLKHPASSAYMHLLFKPTVLDIMTQNKQQVSPEKRWQVNWGYLVRIYSPSAGNAHCIGLFLSAYSFNLLKGLLKEISCRDFS